MAVYLDEDMMGRDDDLVGFPHLLLCMGFVARTNAGPWGVHLTSPANSPGTFTAYCNWAKGKGLTAGAITDLYGCCNHVVRYGTSSPTAGLKAWREEMAAFANQLGWSGPARGFDTGIIDPRDGTYVEYRQQIGGAQPCAIFYKRNEKTVVPGTTSVASQGGTADVVAWDAGNKQFRAMAFPKTNVVGKVSALHTGVFHELDYALRLTKIGV